MKGINISAYNALLECLASEIDTLCYPRAALFTFCLAVMLYNAVSLLKSSIVVIHGEEAVENLSWYYVYTETHLREGLSEQTAQGGEEGNEPGEVVCSLPGRGVTEHWFCSCSVLDWVA